MDAAFAMATALPDLLERLGRDHGRIAQVVREFARETDSLVTTAGPDWLRLAELIDFLRYYADKVHHPLEDRVFDRLLHKGLTPTERHLIFRNIGQHQEILLLTEKIAQAIEAAKQGGAFVEESFEETVAQYLSLQRKHMRFEETHLFPLLQSRLDESDWNELQLVLDQTQDEMEP